MINIFIIGSKGIPANYGGFETFVDNLVRRKQRKDIQYFVSCMGSGEDFNYENAHCFFVPLKKDTAFNRLINVSNALTWVEKYLKAHTEEKTNIVYILGCRVGLLIKKHKKVLKKMGCKIMVNPDGLEWKRSKWNGIQKKILLASEKRLITNSDYIVCDSLGIKDYVSSTYKINKDNINYIAYGSDINESKSTMDEACEWLNTFNTKPNEYYLIVGRFVPENNYELIIKEFLKSKTTKKLLIISNYTKDNFYNSLQEKLNFENDSRIVFVGTLYNEELLKKIRELAFCYIHGHSVGGTNPSLLEGLSYTKINLLFDVSFNKEVGQNECIYFTSEQNDFVEKIDYIESSYTSLIKKLHPKKNIEERYSWDLIVKQYEDLFNRL